jgi:AmmeMemoRadiSam system protein A
LAEIARESIRAAFEGRPPPRHPPVGRRAAVFVTLRIHGDLRGCMGAMEPLTSDLGEEVADRARVAAFEDPRFDPLTREELEDCTIEVTVLGPREPAIEEELDPAVFGVEVADAAGRRGVLLPGIEGVDTVEQQLAIVRRKAGIPPGVPISILRFGVETESHD